MIIFNLENFMLVTATRHLFISKKGARALFGGERKQGGVFFPAHAVVGGFSHSYCEGQVHQCERYGKIVSHSVLENSKVGP